MYEEVKGTKVMCKDEIVVEQVEIIEPDEKDFQLWGLWPRKFITQQEFEDTFSTKETD